MAEADQHGARPGTHPHWRSDQGRVERRDPGLPEGDLQARTESERVSTTALARGQHVSPASASEMVKKLAALARRACPPYRGVTLTQRGRAGGLEVIRHHRLLELYLAETLGIGVDDVHDEADRLEHVLWRSWRSGSTRRSASRPTTRTATRSQTPTSSGPGRASAPCRRLARGRRSRARPARADRPGVSGGRRRSAPARKDLLPREGLDAVAADAVVLEHAHVVLERVVRRLERVAELRSPRRGSRPGAARRSGGAGGLTERPTAQSAPPCARPRSRPAPRARRRRPRGARALRSAPRKP